MKKRTRYLILMFVAIFIAVPIITNSKIQFMLSYPGGEQRYDSHVILSDRSFAQIFLWLDSTKGKDFYIDNILKYFQKDKIDIMLVSNGEIYYGFNFPNGNSHPEVFDTDSIIEVCDSDLTEVEKKWIVIYTEMLNEMERSEDTIKFSVWSDTYSLPKYYKSLTGPHIASLQEYNDTIKAKFASYNGLLELPYYNLKHKTYLNSYKRTLKSPKVILPILDRFASVALPRGLFNKYRKRKMYEGIDSMENGFYKRELLERLYDHIKDSCIATVNQPIIPYVIYPFDYPIQDIDEYVQDRNDTIKNQ